MCMEELEHWAFGLFFKYSLELLLLSFQKIASQISIHLYTASSLSLCELGQFIPLPCLWFPQVLVHEALLLSNRLASASFARILQRGRSEPAHAAHSPNDHATASYVVLRMGCIICLSLSWSKIENVCFQLKHVLFKFGDLSDLTLKQHFAWKDSTEINLIFFHYI